MTSRRVIWSPLANSRSTQTGDFASFGNGSLMADQPHSAGKQEHHPESDQGGDRAHP